MINKGMPFTAKSVRVVDADTMDFLLDLGLDVYHRQRVRIRFIDTPELRGEEREEGLYYKDLAKRVFAKANKVTVVTYGKDKYGRRLADVFIGGQNYIDLLVEESSIPPFPEDA